MARPNRVIQFILSSSQPNKQFYFRRPFRPSSSLLRLPSPLRDNIAAFGRGSSILQLIFILRYRQPFAATELTGRPSKFENHPDFVLSVCNYVRSPGDAAVLRHSRWLTRHKGELETPARAAKRRVAAPDDMAEFQQPANGNRDLDTNATQDNRADEDSVALQSSANQIADVATSSPRDVTTAQEDTAELQETENGIKVHTGQIAVVKSAHLTR
ncbi:uncharacterized protein LOC144122782 [Amblyomma americanum]